MLLGHSYWGYTAPKREKWPTFGAPRCKKDPHRRFGGSKFVADFRFWKYGNKKSFSFFRFVCTIFIREMRRLYQQICNRFETRFWPHIWSISDLKILKSKNVFLSFFSQKCSESVFNFLDTHLTHQISCSVKKLKKSL